MDKNYSIGKLAKEAGVSVRTIRFYIDEGLLPPPQVRGRNTFYGDEYLDRLNLIRRLKEAFLPLREIRQKMQSLSIEEVRALLEHSQPPSDHSPAGVPAATETQAAAREWDDLPVDASPAHENAAEYIARILRAHAAPQVSKLQANFLSSRRSPSSPEPASPLQAPSPPPAAPEAAFQLAESPAPFPRTQSSWQRIVLSPGIELHVSEPVYTEKRAAIQRLIEMARHLFESKLA